MMLLILVVSILLNVNFILPILDQRKNLVVLDDPLFCFLKFPGYFWTIAFIQYGLIVALCVYAYLGWVPIETNRVYLMFTLNQWLRSFAIWLTPLRSHPELRVYTDPVQRWALGEETLHDCMYSGHISNIMLIAFICPYLWYPSLVGAVVTAILMIGSRMHYTIDMFVGVFVAYGIYAFVLRVF